MVRVGIIVVLVCWLILPGVARAIFDQEPRQSIDFKNDGKIDQMVAHRHGHPHGVFLPRYPYPLPAPYPFPYYYYPPRPVVVGCWAW